MIRIFRDQSALDWLAIHAISINEVPVSDCKSSNNYFVNPRALNSNILKAKDSRIVVRETAQLETGDTVSFQFKDYTMDLKAPVVVEREYKVMPFDDHAWVLVCEEDDTVRQ